MSVNYNGNRKKTKTKGLSVPKTRSDFVIHSICEAEPDVILVQESSIKIKKIFPNRYKQLEYDFTQNDQAGILYNKSTLMRVDMDPNQQLFKLRDKMVRENSLSNADELTTRVRAVVLGTKGPVIKRFLCISYHGPHSGYTVQKRLDILKAALQLINEFQKEVPFPVIFGGDFNVDVLINLQLTHKKKVVNTSSGDEICIYYHGLLQLHPYQPTRRREKIYDFLLTSDTIEVQTLKAIDIRDFLENVCPGDDMAILDHDPLVASITLKMYFPLCRLPIGFQFEAWVPKGDKDKCDHERRPTGIKTLIWR